MGLRDNILGGLGDDAAGGLADPLKGQGGGPGRKVQSERPGRRGGLVWIGQGRQRRDLAGTDRRRHRLGVRSPTSHRSWAFRRNRGHSETLAGLLPKRSIA